ncbi:MAG: hypothetical protein ACOYMB_03080 [Patescibacteria group bacterium]
MINWQNRQHRIIIIASAVLLLVILFTLVFLIFSKNKKNNNNQQFDQSQVVSKKKSDLPPTEILQWREKEKNRLAKATHDEALYKELVASKDSSRCQEMQNLDGPSICLFSLASELKNPVLCEQISNKEWQEACRDKTSNLTKPAPKSN